MHVSSLGRTALLLLAASAAAAAAPFSNDDCMKCHGDRDCAATNSAGQAASMYVDASAFKAAAHGDESCVDCHTGIAALPHKDRLRPVDCAGCHADEAAEHLASVHGAALKGGVAESATCRDCHGPAHAILGSDDTNAPTHIANVEKVCASCHADEAAMAKFGFPKKFAVVTYEHSVHGLAMAASATNRAAVCTDCHGVHNVLDVGNPKATLYWRNIPATCGRCHKAIREKFEQSIHGQAVAKNRRDAPVCTDCHLEHTVAAAAPAASNAALSRVQGMCSACHQAARIASRYGLATNVVETYVQSFHGLANGIGGVAAANCASCHGYHDILPSSDPASSVNAANLPKTCGKCHPGIGTRLASGEIKIHQPIGAGTGRPALAVRIVRGAYIVLIVLVIGGMVLHNLLDWLSKVRVHVRAVKRDPGELRLTRLMRMQHIVLIITFVVLAYTGFVHKFPDAWWSWPIRVLPDGSHVRGLIHRIAGWIFTGVFVLHLVLLFATARGRAYLDHLKLRPHDAADFWTGFKGYLRMKPPHHPARRFNFAEKAEYWALVWGSFVMIVTGVMLIFSEAVLRFLPKIWLDLSQVIHLYEAILATLAILVWHMYWIIFDPNEYPMNTAWLIGHKAKHEAPEEDGGHGQR